jgi:hypothetical protein
VDSARHPHGKSAAGLKKIIHAWGEAWRLMGRYPWAVFFSGSKKEMTFGSPSFFSTRKDFQMNSTIKSYLWFVGFMAVTKLVVAPVAKQLNVPIVSDLLA